MLEGNVFITGGAGFLGRAIMRRAKKEQWPCRFTIYSRNEHLQAQCRSKYPDASYVLGDVRDTSRLALVMHNAQYVIHAAAMKFIPEAELNASECVSVNIGGAQSVLAAARATGVLGVVGVSTDKAACPINVYGMSKAVMERLFAETAGWDGPKFTTCRYGNVIGSTGSVVPVMYQQYKDTGGVKITDPDMTRFWMNADQAVQTILQAFSATPGSTTIPNPRSATMMDVAYAVLHTLGLPQISSLVSIVGRRPGEKMHEDLISQYELLRTHVTNEWYTILPPGNETYDRSVVTVSSDRSWLLDSKTLSEWINDSVAI